MGVNAGSSSTSSGFRLKDLEIGSEEEIENRKEVNKLVLYSMMYVFTISMVVHFTLSGSKVWKMFNLVALYLSAFAILVQGPNLVVRLPRWIQVVNVFVTMVAMVVFCVTAVTYRH